MPDSISVCLTIGCESVRRDDIVCCSISCKAYNSDSKRVISLGEHPNCICSKNRTAVSASKAKRDKIYYTNGNKKSTHLILLLFYF